MITIKENKWPGKFACLLVAICLSHASALAQIDVSGKVIPDNDGSPLPGVSIIIKGTTVGPTTDASGNYRISVPDRYSVLVFSYAGFVSEEISVGDQAIIHMVL